MKIKLKESQKKTKYKVLCWHDSPATNTGFGRVARYILKYLHETGMYDFDIVGINHHDLFYDREKYPYNIVASSLLDKRDVYGNSTVLRCLKEKDYDILFVMNDPFAAAQITNEAKKIREEKLLRTGKTFKTIYYYPVDCSMQPEWLSFVQFADFPVAYTEYGKIKTRVHDVNIENVIYHGTDTNIFRPIDREKRGKIRKALFHIENDETFLWMNLNRNSIRKDVSKTILAFKEFQRRVPDSKLYLHMATSDGTWNGGIELNLLVCLRDLGLELGKDVMFPQGYRVGVGIPDRALNEIMNCADAGITTTTSEGYGLVLPELMAAGVPVVAPNNTSFPEIVGMNKQRGYIYPCKERCMIDSCGYRKIGRTEDIIKTMAECYNERGSDTQKQIIERAFEFTRRYSWENIVKQQWEKIFRAAATLKIKVNKEVECL